MPTPLELHDRETHRRFLTLLRRRRRAYVAFHVFSFGDFVIAVGTGVLFGLRRDPQMDTLKRFPMALIPLWGVPVTGALSLMALHRLLVQRPEAAQDAGW